MKKGQKKIYRSYKDFYTDEDLRDPDAVPETSLTIDDFDTKGRILNPQAPCVVTSLDPDYIKDARQQRVVKKFRMKTDILMLREITRTKFMIYSTQQRYLEKQREAEYNEREYTRIKDFFKFAEEWLREMESQGFSELMKVNQILRELMELKLNDELKKLKDEHQQILMAVQDAYRRFLYLLKLLSYFDNIEDNPTKETNALKNNENTNLKTLQKPLEITELVNKDEISSDRMEAVKEYIEKVVKPYLAKKKHLNADVWFQAYEYTREKIFDFNRHFSRVALLNHIFSIIFAKFEKTYAQRMEKQTFLPDLNSMNRRVEALKSKANQIFNIYEKNYKKDKLVLKLRGIIPVILEQVENIAQQRNYEIPNVIYTTSKNCYEQSSALENVERIHIILMKLLQEIDAIPIKKWKQIERQVRKRLRIEKEESRRALAKQTRMKNWIKHFKKHEMPENK